MMYNIFQFETQFESAAVGLVIQQIPFKAANPNIYMLRKHYELACSAVNVLEHFVSSLTIVLV